MEKYELILTNAGFTKSKDLEDNIEVWKTKRVNYFHYIFVKFTTTRRICCFSHSSRNEDEQYAIDRLRYDFYRIEQSKYSASDFEFMLTYLD